MRPKVLCKFKEKCKNYVTGTPCLYSHDKCKHGKDCRNIQNCKFFHQPDGASSKPPPPKFDKPIGQVECKFGPGCKKKLEGKCFFKHSAPSTSALSGKTDYKREERLPPSEIICRDRQRCTLFSLGRCPYKHEQQPVPAPKQENHLGVFDSLCLKFVADDYCDETCSKAHEYTEAKSINKIFTVANCKKMVKKIMILEPYSTQEQPLYVILGDNRIIFGLLTNIAKEGGNQNISNSSLVMKRWFDRDIVFEGEIIQDAWLLKAEAPNNERADILVIRCSASLRILVINRQKMSKFPLREDINGAVFIGNVLLVLTANKVILGYQFDFASAEFKNLGPIINQPLNFIKKYHKSLQGEQFAAGATSDGSICFINSKLKTFKLDLKENVRDICFTEYSNLPIALALVENGKIIAFNLVTFEHVPVLNGNLPRSIICSSITLTQDHLLVAIDGFGILVYNYEQFNKVIGVLALGNCKWKVECNQRGYVALISEDSNERVDANIFRLRRL